MPRRIPWRERSLACNIEITHAPEQHGDTRDERHETDDVKRARCQPWHEQRRYEEANSAGQDEEREQGTTEQHEPWTLEWPAA